MKSLSRFVPTLVVGLCLLLTAAAQAQNKPTPFGGRVKSFEGGVLTVENKKAGETKTFTITETVEVSKSDKSEASSDDLASAKMVRVLSDAEGNPIKVIINVPKPKADASSSE